jgi:DNA sulfur modification protein DndD
MNYKTKSEGYLSGTEDFCKTVTDKYKEYRETKRQIGFLEDEVDKQSDLIIDDTDAKAIENNRKNAHTHYLEAQSDYSTAVAHIGSCNTNIKNCDLAIDKFVKNSAKNQRIAKLISYSEEVYKWLDETYREKEDVVRTELQKRVNDNFSKMYHGERSIIIDDKYRVKYSDVKTDESDGLKAVKSFAFIASLVSMAKDKILDDSDVKLGQDYPLVMDAPFSNVDEIHIDNICKILPHTSNQVIMAVMKKDWDYAATNLNAYVGMSYEIAKDLDEDDKEIDTLTHIKRTEA